MNIEEERKAFEKALPIPLGVYWAVEQRRYMTTSSHLHCTEYQGKWHGWLAAKEHAKEMAKPVVQVEARKDHHQWAVYIPTSLTAEAFDFSTREAAVLWATNNGYRVLEEE